MSSTSVQSNAPTTMPITPRRHLSERQARTVHRLTEAAAGELAANGYHAFTVRSAARRAGVAPATAYTYFASKEHLIAEVYARRLEAQQVARPDRRRTAARRAADVLLDIALVLADESDLAAACTLALLADDPEVADLRVRIGRLMRRRLVDALGDDTDPAVLTTLELVTNGALLRVGTGHLTYGELPRVLAEAASVIVTGSDA